MKIDLRKPDLRTIEVGTIVISSKGFEWEIISRSLGKESWKDLTSGLLWADKEEGRFTHYAAIEKFKDTLPTKKEWEQAEEHGVRDILPNIHHSFCSASVHPGNSNFAFGFDGNYGYIDSFFRDYYGSLSVRCVGR